MNKMTHFEDFKMKNVVKYDAEKEEPKPCKCGSGFSWVNCPGINGDTSFCG